MKAKQFIKTTILFLFCSMLFVTAFCACDGLAIGTPDTGFLSEDGAIHYSVKGGFYSQFTSIELELRTNEYEEIHYTLDGSEPSYESPVYTKPIDLYPDYSDFPKIVCIRAIATAMNRTPSARTAQTYMVGRNGESRFTTDVFCIWGDPDELTNSSTGILSDKNSGNRGADWERGAYLVALDSEGNQLLAQNIGLRAYGGASRDLPIKSMKLYARESYDYDHKTFKANLFDTPRVDNPNKTMNEYKRLVLRNCGNDFQFAYLRDEFVQTLAKKAGFQDYEGVRPAVGYINGAYYGYYWLHENFNHDYFEEKYGKCDGTFYVAEGNEQWKYEDNYEEQTKEREVVKGFNDAYYDFLSKDLTKDSEYARLTEWMDVENYLDYYALNIYICNWDWPQNNYKCYRYVAAKGESYGEGVFDGRWRFLPHDMDYSFGLYDQDVTQANYDNLGMILNSKTDRYSPMFTALMKREDCRQYFISKIYELMDSVMAPDNCIQTLEEVHDLRMNEQNYYIKYLVNLRNQGVYSIWTDPGHLDGFMKGIYNFINQRPAYMAKYLSVHLAER